MRYLGVFASLALLASMPAEAHDHEVLPRLLNDEELLEVMGGVDKTEIHTEKVAEGLYVLWGLGGNVAVSVGEQGVLIVDDQFPQIMPKIEAAIHEVNGKAIDFVVNTHWHFDHADGNKALGPQGSWIIAQENSRAMMLDDHIVNMVWAAYEQKAYPQKALPVVTYGTSMQLHFNGEQIDLLHFGPAHTTGDTAVYFRKSNALHMGDVFSNIKHFPFIDSENGGGLAGMVAFCRAVLKEVNEDTVVIPGHGPIASYAELLAYTDMLETVHTRMKVLVGKGATLDDVIAADVAKEWRDQWGDPTMFLNRSYLSMKKPIADR